MPSELDPNEIAIGVATHIFDSTVDGIGSTISAQVKKLGVKFKKGFSDYISHSLKRTSYIKTIIHSDESVKLNDLYVKLSYEVADRGKRDIDIINYIRSGKKVLISGTAGGGKSILIKHLNNVLLLDYKGVLPIFFELRALNNKGGLNLVEALLDHLNIHIKLMNAEIFTEYLKSGKIALILDGFDEIDHNLRSQYGYEIQGLQQNYPKLAIAITSRPEENLPGLEDFTVFNCQPMSKLQTISMLKKIDYDKEKKNEFIRQVKSHLYDRHTEFLSNPLLTNMMLLTYSHHSDIPEKIHIFYQQAFETLFQRHDRSKGVYTRKSYTELPMDEFQRIFEHFCAASYISSNISFNGDEIRKYIRKAIDYVGLNLKVDDFLSDLKESVCLMQNDGIEFSFVHRSFQEYFAAKFISSLSDDQMTIAVDAIAARADSDSVISILMSINEDGFDRSWLVPTLKQLIELGGDGKSLRNLFPEVFMSITMHAYGCTLINSHSNIGASAMAIWHIYSLIERHDDSYVDRMKIASAAINNNAELLTEFISISSSIDIIDYFINPTKYGENDIHSIYTSIKLNSISKKLYKALDVDQIAHNEYDAWIEILSDTSEKMKRRSQKFDDIFS
jgi:energy-coupling factor transporter ATP-binding protein EcfA2